MVSAYNKEQEDEAGWLAGCLLLPKEALLSIRRRGLNNQSAAAYYGVSAKMLEWRIAMSGVDYMTGRKKRGKKS